MNMLADDTQTPIKIVNMEFNPSLNKKLFLDEKTLFIACVSRYITCQELVEDSLRYFFC